MTKGILEGFFETYDLGEIMEKRLFNHGNSHEVYYVATASQKYVVKVLDEAKIAKDRHFTAKFIKTEEIAEGVCLEGFASVPAIRFHGSFIQEFEGHHLAVYPFCPGQRISMHVLTTKQREAVGEALAELHEIPPQLPDLKNFTYGWSRKENKKTWTEVRNELTALNPSWLEIFDRSLSQLISLTEQVAHQYQNFTPQDVVLSHGDVSSDNILFEGDKPYFLDWEKASLVDAAYEVLRTAIRFSLQMYSSPDKIQVELEHFYDIVRGYTQRRTLNLDELERYFHLFLHIRIQYLQYYIYLYQKEDNEGRRQTIEKNILLYLRIVEGYQRYLSELPQIQKRLSSL